MLKTKSFRLWQLYTRGRVSTTDNTFGANREFHVLVAESNIPS